MSATTPGPGVRDVTPTLIHLVLNLAIFKIGSPISNTTLT